MTLFCYNFKFIEKLDSTEIFHLLYVAPFAISVFLESEDFCQIASPIC